MDANDNSLEYLEVKVLIKLHLRTGNPNPGLRSHLTLRPNIFACVFAVFFPERIICILQLIFSFVFSSSEQSQLASGVAIWVKSSPERLSDQVP